MTLNTMLCAISHKVSIHIDMFLPQFLLRLRNLGHEFLVRFGDIIEAVDIVAELEKEERAE